MKQDIRSKRCAFVSHCILAQCFMANGLVRTFPAMITPVVRFCLDHNINIIQMPCPETLCASGGLGREPHGKSWYEEHGLRETAKTLAENQARYMKTLIDAGNEVLAVIGIEFSPACAVNYLNKGPVILKDKGIYIEELQRQLAGYGIEIPFMAVNFKAPVKLERQLREILLKEEPQCPETIGKQSSRNESENLQLKFPPT